MSNAEVIFNGINSYADVQNLIGTQETIFLDFKERDPGWRTPGKLSDNEKRTYSKAASGFAHQEGGVLLWGIEARKDAQGIDQAFAIKPFNDVKQFSQTLQQYVAMATDPIVDGVRHKIVFENDSSTLNRGFVASLFPKSNRVHRALGGTTNDFYKRQGDSFVPLSTEDTRALFFRTLSPELQFITTQKDHHLTTGTGGPRVYVTYKIAIKNVGAGLAKHVAFYFGLTEPRDVDHFRAWDEGGNEFFKLGRLLERDYASHGRHFILQGDIVIYPGEELPVLTLTIQRNGIDLAPRFKFKLFAENMVPKEGET